WCSETINALHAEGLIESQIITPRRINKLTSKGMEIAKHLKEINDNILANLTREAQISHRLVTTTKMSR
ncbi:MAG: hypothetical protein ACUVQP_11900, partial [Bacteroidales bacterium]